MRPVDPDVPEVEVTPLDPRAPGGTRRAALTRWLRTRSGRLAVSALVCALTLVALVGMVARATSDPLGAARIALGIATPTDTPLIPPGGGTFGLTNTVPWGALRIDGHDLTANSTGPFDMEFILPRGVHHLVYQARDFPTLSCVISVPRSTRDTCPLASAAEVPGVTFQRWINLGATPERLIGGQYLALLAAVSHVVESYSASTIIQPGERYINQAGQSEVATAKMTFTIGMRLDQRKVLDCGILCPTTIDRAQPNTWYIDAEVEPVWTVTDATGRSYQSGIMPYSNSSSGVMLATSLSGSSWNVMLQDSGPLDSIVQSTALFTAQSQIGDMGQTMRTYSGGDPADGAVVMLQTATTSLVILWRFGVLYAANSASHTALPALPLASPAEQALALQMAATGN